MIPYLEAYEDYFWQWEDNYEVIAIPNSYTIVYSQYLFDELLPLLAENGLPPFGSLLLALLALNENGKESIDYAISIIKKKLNQIQKDDISSDKIIEEATSFLAKLYNLPNKYRMSTNKTRLICFIFQGCHNHKSVRSSKSVVEYVTHQRAQFVEGKRSFIPSIFKNDFRTLSLLDAKFKDSEQIISSLATLLPIPDDVEIEPKEDQEESESKDFIEELMSNEHTFTIGILIKRIWSALNIPFHQSLPSSQPIGGVYDLTNRGSIDRMLISEYANEDLIFLTRVANNEVLYVQRETPPQKNEKIRYILIDTSIRNWGTPKTIAFSIALSISKHPKSNIITKWFAIGDDSQGLMFDQIEDLMESILVTSARLDASKGLEHFFQTHKSILNKDTEIVLISSKISSHFPDFQIVQNQYFSQINHWIETDREGGVWVYKNEHKSKKYIQYFKLPIETLWEKRVSVNFVSSIITPDLGDYPILFPFNKQYRFVYQCEKYDFIIDKQLDMFRIYNPSESKNIKGWHHIYSKIPNILTIQSEIGIKENGELAYVSYTTTKEILYINLSRKKEYKSPIPFTIVPRMKIIFFKDHFYIRNYYETTKIEISENEELVFTNIGTKEFPDSNGCNPSKLQYRSFNRLVNIQNVCVTTNYELVINKHVLKLDATYKVIMLKRAETIMTNRPENFVYATPDRKKGVFTFNNGSKIQFLKSGMMILYPKQQLTQYCCKLLDSGTNKIALVKGIKHKTQLSLSECKNLVDNTPSVLFTSLHQEEVKGFASELQSIAQDCKLDITSTSQSFRIYIPTTIDNPIGIAAGNSYVGSDFFYLPELVKKEPDMEQFWEKTIQFFIDEIINNR